MKTPRRTNARSVALAALLECRKKEAFAQEVLERQFQEHPLSAADRRLVTQIVFGVLRRRGTLDALLGPLVKRPMAEVQPWLWEALRLGAFQIALLTQIPAHAALFETVELAASQGEPKAKTFLNAVLRGVSRLLVQEKAEAGRPEAYPTDGPAADALPLAGGRYRKLNSPVFANPGDEPVAYLTDAFALPRWLVERWLPRLGWEECVRLGFWFAGPAPTYLRVNPLRADRSELLGTLLQAEVEAEEGRHPQSIKLLEHALIRDLPGFAEGQFVVQDESAMQVAGALLPQPGWHVLDLCAGPGSKSTHLAELMANQGKIVACDVDAERLAPLRETCKRLGLSIVETRVVGQIRSADSKPRAGAAADFVGPDSFDAVLVDVPCSNTGVLGRRPEARWRLRPADLAHLVELQAGLLERGVALARPGGAIVYSTCSIEPEENRGVLDKVLAASSGLVLEVESGQSPGQPSDGGYWARLRKP